MITKEFEIIKSNGGGIYLDTDMAIWMMEMKNWQVLEDGGKNFESVDHDLICLHDTFWLSEKYPEEESRTNLDLIECIKSLQSKYRHLKPSQQSEYKVFDFSIEKIVVSVSISVDSSGKEVITAELEK